MAERLSPEAYVEAGGMVCPACGGAVLQRFPDSFVRQAMLTVKQRVTCARCAASWHVVYALAGYEGLGPREEVAP